MTIKSPYNFVPVSDKVFFPDWADKVSHDVPFSDGISGVIDVKITAKTPIYVKNGTADNNDTTFSNYKGKYFIPGTSIKGMIRNVFEIMTFSKMQQVENRRFSWRDLTNKHYTENFTTGINARPLVEAGYIIKEGNNWRLIPCKYARIEQYELAQEIGTEKLSAKDKYDFWESKGEDLINNFSISNLGTNVFEKQCGSHYRAKFNDGNIEGQIVFTGQIGPRNNGGEGKHGKGKKHLEFVFFNESDSKLEIPNTMRKDFELNHSNERNRERHSNALSPNEEWGYWKEKLENGGKMPVFWLKNPKGDVSSFGLAMLYRLPLQQTVHDQIFGPHVSHLKDGQLIEDKFKEDMSDLLFGHITKNKTLKGRVQFSHAFALGSPKVLKEKREVLGSPKATFYPNYLESGDYTSRNKVSGRKRYPVHNKIKEPANKADNQNIESQFIPLAEGTEFNFKVRYHNLKKMELGALLSALTFHNTQDCFHSLGMAKSLGYGKVRLELSNPNMIDYLKHFEREINIFYHQSKQSKDSKNYWAKAMTELVTMATEQAKSDTLLEYMNTDDHVKAKKNKEYLKRYSKLTEERLINSYFDEVELKAIYEEADKSREEKKRILLEQKKAAETKAKEEEVARKQAKAKEYQAKKEAEEEAKLKQEMDAIKANGINKALEKKNAGGVVSDAYKFFEVQDDSLLESDKVKIYEKLIELNDKKLKKIKKSKDLWKKLVEMLGDDLVNDLKTKLGAK